MVNEEQTSVETALTQRRAEYVKALQCALDKIVSHLADMPQVEQVILFGSYAAGATCSPTWT